MPDVGAGRGQREDRHRTVQKNVHTLELKGILMKENVTGEDGDRDDNCGLKVRAS